MSDQESLNTLVNDGELPPDGHSKTEPPTADNHGFLEQFEAYSASAFEQLKLVAEQGLTGDERLVMFKAGLKLFALAAYGAKEEDFTPEHKAEIESLVSELESTLNLL